MQYIEFTLSSNMVKGNFCCMWVRWSTSDQLDYSACRKDVKRGALIIGQW